MTAWRRLLALFAWRYVGQKGAWVYEENAVTGKRRANYSGGGYSPIDVAWLNRRREGLEVNPPIGGPYPFEMPKVLR